MPEGPDYWYRVPETGQVERMPWYDNTREPTDYEIDSYRSQRRYEDSQSWTNRYIPEPVRDTFNWAMTPISDAPSRWARQISPHIPQGLGLNVGKPAVEFMGDIGTSMLTPANIGLTAISGGAWGAGRLGLGATARALGGIEMGAGIGQMGLGGYHLSQAETMPQAAGAGLEILFGGLGYRGGRGTMAANRAVPEPGFIQGELPLGTGAGPDGPGGGGGGWFDDFGDVADPNLNQGRGNPEMAGTAPIQRGGIEVAGLESSGQLPLDDPRVQPPTFYDPLLQESQIHPDFVESPAVDLQLQSLENPRSPTGLRPFEQDASLWQQFRNPVAGEPMDLGGYNLTDPLGPSVMPDQYRPAVDLQTPEPTTVTPRAIIEEQSLTPEPPVTPGPRVGQPPAPRTAAEARAYVEGLAQQNAELTGPNVKTVEARPTGALADLRDPADVPFEEHVAATRPTVDPEVARLEAERIARTAPLPEPVRPLVETPTPAPEVPAAPKKPTPDRVLRIQRGMHDAVRVIFPDRLHADLFSAFGRMRKQMRGKGGIPPDFEGLARRMGTTEKEVARIASEYRNRVMTMTKEFPATAPEGTDVFEMEAPHWGGGTPEPVTTPKPTPKTAKEIEWARVRAERQASIDEAIAAEAKMKAMGESRPSTPQELAEMEARHRATQEAYAEEERLAAAADRAARGEEALLPGRVKPTKPPVTQLPKLPKSKNDRIALVMDELGALPDKDVIGLLDDPKALGQVAKGAGIKPATLRSAIQEWFAKAGGSETGSFRFGRGKKEGAKPVGPKGGVAAFPAKATNLFEVTQEIAKLGNNPEAEFAIEGLLQRGKDLIRKGIGPVKTLEQRAALDRKLIEARTNLTELDSLANRTKEPNAAELYRQLTDEQLDAIAEIKNIQKADDARFGFGEVRKMSEIREEGGFVSDKPTPPPPKPPEKTGPRLVSRKPPPATSQDSSKLRAFRKTLMDKIEARIPDIREQKELEGAITDVWRDINKGERTSTNPTAKRAIDLLNAVRSKNTEGATFKWAYPNVSQEIKEVAKGMKELSYGMLKMEKEDLVRHFLETGELKLPPPEMNSPWQEWFSDVGGSETGALRLPTKADLGKAAGKAFDVANQVRMTSMLSGLALPKSLAGNIGAHLIAVLENKSLTPLKVLGNVKSIAQDLKYGWTRGANPAMVGGVGKLNLPGRAMGAADWAATQSLQRAGLSLKDAKEILLTGPNPVSAWPAMNTRLGKFMVPFRTTPFNQFGQFLTRWKKHPDVYAASVVLGALAGANIEDKEALALTSAFAGPYAIPFLIGASLSKGKEALSGISPIPEWGITRTISDPFASIRESPGLRWFRSNLGFGKQAAIEKRIEEGKKVGRSKRSRRARPSS